MYKRLLIALVLLYYVLSLHELYELEEFVKFTRENNKHYSSVNEYITRYNIFKKNLERVKTMTLTRETSHTVGITKFMDMTLQEFRRIYLNLKIDPSHFSNSSRRNNLKFLTDAPDALDWREKGAVGAVKDQGQCGSCWAFSTVGNLEGLNVIKSGKMVQFSEQQLVDCDKKDSGCDGGLMENAFDYLKQAGGIEQQSDYPYHAKRETCHFNSTEVVLKVTGSVIKADMDENEMKDMLANTGPLAIALNADILMLYNDGVIEASAADCDPAGLNHGVTLVGYGSEDGKDYWIVKNSWGANWGEKGYFRMARGKGTCGINKYVTSATIE
jgi:cathepsin F